MAFNDKLCLFCYDLWQTLSQLLCESRGENKALKKDFAELRQLYNDAQEDIQILREALAKEKNCSNKIKDGTDGMDPRQDLISQLEKSQEKVWWECTTIDSHVQMYKQHVCDIRIINVRPLRVCPKISKNKWTQT